MYACISLSLLIVYFVFFMSMFGSLVHATRVCDLLGCMCFKRFRNCYLGRVSSADFKGILSSSCVVIGMRWLFFLSVTGKCEVSFRKF
jgi:hypothetical protein